MDKSLTINKNRIEWIDIAKGIGIILVILGHLSQHGQTVRILIYSFHMPLFFFVSGYLYKEKNLKLQINHGIKKLIIPAYCFVVFDMLLSVVKAMITNTSIDYKDIIKGFLILGGTLKNSPIWFLLVLFICNCLQSLVKNNKYSQYIVLLVCLFASIPQYYCGFGMCWYIAFFACMFFYEVGYLFKGVKYDINRVRLILLFVGMIIVWIALTMINGEVDIVWVTYGKSFLLLVVTSLLGINIVFVISKYIDKFKASYILKEFGKNSLYILLTHYYFTKYIFPFAFKSMNLEIIEYNIIVEMVLLITMMVLYSFAFLIIKKIRQYKIERK